MLSRLSGACLALSVVASVLVAVGGASPASAVTAAQWQAGNIISDAAFYNSTTMDAAHVQSFFNSVYTGCSSGYTCIRDYHVSTPNRSAESHLCNGYSASSSQSAAQIIANVATSCGVNPQALIVLIQKESGDITSWTPGYQQVTGYGCPDSTGCDAQYYGFFNQVYLAARQFKLYRLYPNNYGYVAGTTNYILYNPNTNCGGSQVYITNQATAGLYDYTPYQPNAAALANLHGTGNSCSAYGNRNFWVFYNQWFGSTQAGSYLVRTLTDPAVYFVNNGSKFPITSMATLNSLPSAAGTVGIVAQSYLDTLPTGVTMSRFVRGPDGSIYFFDSATAFHAPTCAVVTAYGVACSADSFVPVPASIVTSFTQGATLTQVAATTSGRRYYVTGGTRREVLDDQSLIGMGVPTASITVSDAAIGGLTLAMPVLRDDVTIQNRADSSTDLYSSGNLYPISSTLYTGTPTSQAVPIAGKLDPASLAMLTLQPPVSGYAVDAVGNSYVVTATGKAPVGAPAALGVAFTTWPTGVLTTLPTIAGTTAPILVKQANSPTTYVVDGGIKYSVGSWSDAQAITRDLTPSVVVLLSQEFGAIPAGTHAALVPGELVKSATDPGVYLVNGFTSRVHVSSLAVVQQLGLHVITVVNASTLGAYQVQSGDLGPTVSANGVNYVVVGGVLRSVSPANQAYYGLTYSALDPVTFRNLGLTIGAPVTGPLFVQASNSAVVYQLTGGIRHAVPNWGALLQLNHGTAPKIVMFTPEQLAAIPLGR